MDFISDFISGFISASFQISLYSRNNMIVQICYLQYELLCIFCQSHSQPENDLFLSTSRQVVGENFQFSPLL